MAASFPISIKSFSTKVDNVTPIVAAHVNDLQDEVVAIETELVSGGGWRRDANTWTYVSATTFTVAADITALWQVGMRLRLKQGGGYKYFYVVSLSYSAPNTTVTVTGGSDYSLANAAITDNYWSFFSNPLRFPDWFNYTPTGVSASNVTLTGRFKLIGRQCVARIHMAFAGGITFTTMPTLPITAAVGLTTYDDGDTDLAQSGYGGYFDSGTATVLGTIYPNVPSSATVLTITTSAGANMSATVPITWANADQLSITCEYEI